MTVLKRSLFGLFLLLPLVSMAGEKVAMHVEYTSPNPETKIREVEILVNVYGNGAPEPTKTLRKTLKLTHGETPIGGVREGELTGPKGKTKKVKYSFSLVEKQEAVFELDEADLREGKIELIVTAPNFSKGRWDRWVNGIRTLPLYRIRSLLPHAWKGRKEDGTLRADRAVVALGSGGLPMDHTKFGAIGVIYVFFEGEVVRDMPFPNFFK
jgi:hypothetical protein